MKSRTCLVISTAVVLAGLLVWAGPTWSKEAQGRVTKVLMVDCPFPPFVIEESDQAPRGLSVDILRELFRRLGVKMEFKVFPWKRALRMAETGRADGVSTIIFNEERNHYLDFSEVIIESRETFFYRPEELGDFDWADYGDLKPYTIGLVEGYVYGGDFLEVVKKYGLRVDYAQSSEENLTKLNGGRVDLVLEDEHVARDFINSQGWSKRIKSTRHASSVAEYRLAFSRRSPAQSLLPEVNRVISEMKQDGTIREFLDHAN